MKQRDICPMGDRRMVAHLPAIRSHLTGSFAMKQPTRIELGLHRLFQASAQLRDKIA